MRRSLLVVAMLLCATWMLAQTSPTTNPSSTSSQSASSSASKTTVTGCLSGSSGNYTLTDKSGTAYQLTGDTANLTEHVGHEISVTGTSNSSESSASTNSGTGSSSTNTASQKKLDVSSFKHLSSTCTSSH